MALTKLTSVDKSVAKKLLSELPIQVSTVAEMKTKSYEVGQVVETVGYYAEGDAGAARYLVKAAQAVDGYADHTLANGTVAVLQSGGIVDIKQLGAVGDYNVAAGTGTDNALALQAAQEYCKSKGKGLRLTGRFGTATAIIQRSIRVSGISREVSGIYALNDNHRILTRDALDTGGDCVLENFTIHGYADRNTTQGGDTSALVEISAFDSVTFEGMEGAWSRQMGFKSRAIKSTANNCYMHHLLRDGINFSDSEQRIVTNNIIEYVADDAIACHSNESNFKTTSVITGNTLFNTFGIKCLSSRFTIANNNGNMLYGYGVTYGKASGFTEGEIDIKCSSVSNNNFSNIINTNKVGGGDLGAAIYGRPLFEANTNGVFSGDYDTTLNAFVDPLETINTYGAGISHIGSMGVSIVGNNVMQTWTGGVTISDFGYGEAWTTSGFSDITLSGTLGFDGNKVSAYRFNTVAENITCMPSVSYGFTLGYEFLNMKRFRNFDASIGQMSRIYKIGISISKDASVSVLQCEGVKIEGGILDMDPMHEQPDREIITGEPTGGWTNTSSQNCIGLLSINVRGFVWKNTIVRNMQRTATVSGGGAIAPLIRDLVAYRGDGGAGIGNILASTDQFSIYTDSDPRSASYGQILQGNLSNKSSLPTAEYYFEGQQINNSDYTATISGDKFVKIIRLTTGNAHVFGVDWGIVPLTVV